MNLKHSQSANFACSLTHSMTIISEKITDDQPAILNQSLCVPRCVDSATTTTNCSVRTLYWYSVTSRHSLSSPPLPFLLSRTGSACFHLEFSSAHLRCIWVCLLRVHGGVAPLRLALLQPCCSTTIVVFYERRRMASGRHAGNSPFYDRLRPHRRREGGVEQGVLVVMCSPEAGDVLS